MGRRLLAVLLAAMAAPAHAQSLEAVPRYAAIVLDADRGEVLYERRADDARHPASITKVMTLYLAFDAIEAGRLKLDDLVEMTPAAVRQPPSKLGLKLGETLTVEQAVRVIAVKSANDVAVALAERIGGSEAEFTRAMNAKAQALGMTRTFFANASGLPNVGHYTTARDLATLSRALLRYHGDRYRYFSEQSVDWAGRFMPNHNKLLGRVPGVDGIKTGYTAASGFTLAASAMRAGHRLIAIVLGSPSGVARDANVEALLEAGFSVIQRRAAGGRATVAALLGEGEPAPGGDPIGALIEQGSGTGGR